MAARRRGEDIGAPSVLAAYERARRPDIASRTTAVDLLNRSLLSDLLPVQLLRGLGLYLAGRGLGLTVTVVAKYGLHIGVLAAVMVLMLGACTTRLALRMIGQQLEELERRLDHSRAMRLRHGLDEHL